MAFVDRDGVTRLARISGWFKNALPSPLASHMPTYWRVLALDTHSQQVLAAEASFLCAIILRIP